MQSTVIRLIDRLRSWKRSVAALGLLVLLAGLLGASTATLAEGQWDGIGDSTWVDLGNPIRSRRSPDASLNVYVTNLGSARLEGPLRLVLADLSPDTVSLSGPDGITNEAEPFVDLVVPAGGLAPGERLGPVSLTIVGGGRVIFDLAARLEQLADTMVPLAVHITDPPTLLTVGASPILVEGTVSPEDATLTINGAPVAHSGGSFQAQVNLEEGLNHIVARALDDRGGEVTDSVAISMDLTPPFVTVESPLGGEVLTTNEVAVTGLVNDIVRGTISATEANVVVNGVPASVSNRTYLATGVPLVPGPNQITVTASDEVGNVGQAQVTVAYEPPIGQQIALVSGQGQQGDILTELGEPLTVRLDDGTGNPVVGRNVVFRVIQGDGVVGVGTANVGRAVLLPSGADGTVSTAFQLGSRAGNGNHRVRASAVNFAGEVVFHASAVADQGDKVSVIAGNNQRGAADQPLPEPLTVAVTDVGSNLIAGAQVQFDVTAGVGLLQNGQSSQTVVTDNDGRASVEWTLGSLIGLDSQRVTASLVGTDAKAGFLASALEIGDPGDTRISGVVLDNQDNPVPGVTIRVDGTTREAAADAQGQFLITEVPVGPVHLLADGSTATVPGEWPTLSYNLVTVAGAENPLASPIYMVKLDTDNAQLVGLEDVEYTLDEIPGFELTVKAGSVTFPDGTNQGLLSVTPVNANKVPMPPPNGMQPQFIVTIQPAGTRFDPPAPLTLPNVDGHAPGAQVEMYSYDHDLEEFVTIGLGTVSADGQLIASNPGVGVIKAGWHCGSQPGGSGCAHNCPECASCDANCMCYWDNSKTPTSLTDTPGDCKKPGCQDGPKQVPDDSDAPPDNAHPDNICKKCDGGDFVADSAKDDTCCSDGMCESGTCKPVELTSVDAKADSKDEDVVVFTTGGKAVNFSGSATGTNCEYEYKWDFGDGQSDTVQNPTHTYANPGVYDAKLTVNCKKCPPGDKTDTVKVYVVKLDVKQGGIVITDTTHDEIVGKKIALTAELVPASETLTDIGWSVPGNRVKSFTGSVTTGTLTPLTTLNTASIEFHWVDGGNGRKVTVSGKVKGTPVTAEATFDVKQPTSAVTTSTGAVAVDSAWGNLELHFGSPATPGISFSRTITVPTGFSGTTQWVQTVVPSRRRQLNNGNWQRLVGGGLDTSYPYSASASTSDSPGAPLTASYLKKEVNTESFVMYLMFKPTDAGSIWIPLKRTTWSWSGKASRSGTSWTLDSSGKGTPATSDTTTFPTWTTNITGATWQNE